jgi:hypothetical protein
LPRSTRTSVTWNGDLTNGNGLLCAITPFSLSNHSFLASELILPCQSIICTLRQILGWWT